MKTAINNLATLALLLVGLLFLFGSANASICCNCSGPHCTSDCVEDPNANDCGSRGECSSEACTPPAWGVRMEGEAFGVQERGGKHGSFEDLELVATNNEEQAWARCRDERRVRGRRKAQEEARLVWAERVGELQEEKQRLSGARAEQRGS